MSKEPATPVATHHQAISTEQVRAGQAWAFSNVWMIFDHHMTTDCAGR
jgi:hypothetical protein